MAPLGAAILVDLTQIYCDDLKSKSDYLEINAGALAPCNTLMVARSRIHRQWDAKVSSRQATAHRRSVLSAYRHLRTSRTGALAAVLFESREAVAHRVKCVSGLAQAPASLSST